MDARPLADRVAGLVLFGFQGTTAAEAPADLVREAAGVILFARNIVTAQQTADLIAGLRAAAVPDAPPPLIAVDEEGGTVSRLAAIGTTIPSAMALGAAADDVVTRGAYEVIGEELAALGIGLDFAPVADVNDNPRNPVIGVRSFGDDPAAVARQVRAAVAGLHAAGAGATAKHFPGHGAASVDSHGALPVIANDAQRLREIDLVPFAAAVDAGVDAIMTAHVALPSIDPSGLPATLSRPIITGVLREEMHFDGIVVTDCMQMGAVADIGPEAAVMAVAAGADLVCYSSSVEAARAAVATLRDALACGRLSADRIERSLARVGALRAALGSARPAEPSSVGSDAHRTRSLDAARAAVTVVRDPQGVVPLKLQAGQKIFLVQFAGEPGTPAESAGRQSTCFGKALASGAARVQEQIRSLEPAGHEYKQLLMASASADVIVAVTRRAWSHPLQARAVADLALAGKPLAIVAAREPYDADVAPEDAAVIATYGDDPASMAAAAEVLLGTIQARGRLPVSLAGRSSSAGVAT